MLDVEALLELEDNIRKELDDHLPAALSMLNRTGELETFLKMLGMEDLLQSKPLYQVYKTGKIIVIGRSDVKAKVLLSIAKSLGLSKDRFELYLDYEDGKTFDFEKAHWKPQYALIMVGPMPHSGVSKGNSGSVIAKIESTEGYPPVVRLGANGLKITKTDFRNKLKEMIDTKKNA